MNTNELKHFRDVMLKLDFMFIYYIVTLILCYKISHKHNEKRKQNVINLNVRTKTNQYIKNEKLK